jgi:hypothetical protein
VVILPDTDEAGRAHAQTVAAAARRHGAASVKVLELPGLPPKGDVTDWLAAGHGAEELRTLIAETPEWEPAAGTAATKTAPVAGGDRTEIRLSEEHVNDVARQCAALLSDELFMRGSLPAVLVRAETLPASATPMTAKPRTTPAC